jgi:hypothetical protein
MITIEDLHKQAKEKPISMNDIDELVGIYIDKCKSERRKE